MARGMLGRKSPIQARQKRGEALKEADVVVLAGQYLNFNYMHAIMPCWHNSNGKAFAPYFELLGLISIWVKLTIY